MDASDAKRQRELVTVLAGELAGVVSALLGSAASAVETTSPPTPGWTIGCSVTGPLSGRITLAVSEGDATALARRLMGMDEDPADDAVVDTLGEVVGQAVGGLSQNEVAAGAKIRVDRAAARGSTAPSGAPALFDVVMEDGTTLRFACWAEIEGGGRVAAAAAPAAAPDRATSGLSAAAGPPAPTAPLAGMENLEVILDIELPLTVRFGRAEMTLQALTHLGPGTVIDLDRPPDEPVEILINDKVIARGEVVVVSGNYGVRVTEVTSAVDRIRSLGP